MIAHYLSVISAKNMRVFTLPVVILFLVSIGIGIGYFLADRSAKLIIFENRSMSVMVDAFVTVKLHDQLEDGETEKVREFLFAKLDSIKLEAEAWLKNTGVSGQKDYLQAAIEHIDEYKDSSRLKDL